MGTIKPKNQNRSLLTMADGDSPKAVKDEENTFSFLLFPIKIILHTMVMILKHDKNVELLILREHLISPSL